MSSKTSARERAEQCRLPRDKVLNAEYPTVNTPLVDLFIDWAGTIPSWSRRFSLIFTTDFTVRDVYKRIPTQFVILASEGHAIYGYALHDFERGPEHLLSWPTPMPPNISPCPPLVLLG